MNEQQKAAKSDELTRLANYYAANPDEGRKAGFYPKVPFIPNREYTGGLDVAPPIRGEIGVAEWLKAIAAKRLGPGVRWQVAEDPEGGDCLVIL